MSQTNMGLLKTKQKGTDNHMAYIASNSLDFMGCLNLDLLTITYNLEIK